MNRSGFSRPLLAGVLCLAAPLSAWGAGAAHSRAPLVHQRIEHGRAVCEYEQDGQRSSYELPPNQQCPKAANLNGLHPGWILGTEGHLVRSSTQFGSPCVYRDQGQTERIAPPGLGGICPAFHIFYIRPPF